MDASSRLSDCVECQLQFRGCPRASSYDHCSKLRDRALASFLRINPESSPIAYCKALV